MNEQLKAVLEKIKKLLALANKDKNNSIHEAELAMDKAKKLMAEYNITMSDVQVEEIKKEKTNVQDAAMKSSFSSWDGRLFYVCDELFNVAHYRSQKYSGMKITMKFYGIAADVELAIAVYSILYKMCMRASNQWKSWHDRNSYLDGYTHCLHDRAKKMAEGLTKKQEEKCTAIVVVKNAVLTRMHFTSTKRTIGDIYDKYCFCTKDKL